MLLDECAAGRVTIRLGHAVREVDHADGAYRVTFGDRTASAPALVIATGGPSIPKMGATGFAYDLARRFGLKVVEPRPALVPLTLGGDETLFRVAVGRRDRGDRALRQDGVSRGRAVHPPGLSGPAILQISSYWRHGESIGIDFLPALGAGWLADAKRARPRGGAARGAGEPLARPPRRNPGRPDRASRANWAR